jgi:hypothetical protein
MKILFCHAEEITFRADVHAVQLASLRTPVSHIATWQHQNGNRDNQVVKIGEEAEGRKAGQASGSFGVFQGCNRCFPAFHRDASAIHGRGDNKLPAGQPLCHNS